MFAARLVPNIIAKSYVNDQCSLSQANDTNMFMYVCVKPNSITCRLQWLKRPIHLQKYFPCTVELV